jgi:3-methyl-2-oxobutanoate hydroxymethyltransferase
MKILEDALAIEDAGCFMLEFEAVPARIARLISQQLTIPTIGIGAGPHCDGQVLVLHDMLGLNEGFSPKFLRRFAELGVAVREAVRSYADEVRGGRYPGKEHSFE